MLGLGGVKASFLLRNAQQGGVNVFGHSVRVAAYIHVSAGLDPFEQIRRVFEHAILNVKFLLLVARKRQVEPIQLAIAQGCLPLSLVQKVRVEMRVAKEKPVTSFTALVGAFLDKSAKRRDSRTGSDHDYVSTGINGQAEAGIFFNEYTHAFAFSSAAQKARRCTATTMSLEFVVDVGDRKVHFVFHYRLA